MALQEFGIGIVIGGTLASSFKSSFKNANNSITKMQTNVKSMSKTALTIKNFKTLQKDASKNRTALSKMGASLKKAGVDVKNLDRDSKLLRISLVHLKRASRVQIKIDGIKDQFKEQKASILGIGASLIGMTSVVRKANDVLKAQGEIRSLDISTKGIDAITKAGHEMSLQFGQITAPQFIKASYDIKSGISSLSDEGVKNMTNMAAVTAVATKSSTEEMTKLYALGYGIFREDFSSDMDFGKKFSGAIAGAVQAFRTDGSDLAGGISNIGASAKAMGVSFEEELSIIGLAKGAFSSASEAGSGYRAFLDGAGKAQKTLGLAFTDANGQMLPMVNILEKIKEKYGDLDLSEIDELKTGFGSSEAVKIITALLPKTKELAAAQKSLRNAMDGGLTKSEAMAKAMDSGYGFEKMGNAMKYMSFTIGKAVAPAVDKLATGLGALAKGISWLDTKVPMLVPVFSGLAFGVIGLITTLKIATLTKLAYSLAVNTLKKSILLEVSANYRSALSLNRVTASTLMASAKSKVLAFWQGVVAMKSKAVALWSGRAAIAQRGAALASGLFAGGMKAVNLVLRANPIGLVVTALGALAAGAVWAYNKLEWFREGVDGVWSWIKTAFSWSPFGVVTEAWGAMFDWLGTKFDWFSTMAEGFSDITSNIGSYLGFGDDENKLEIGHKIKKVTQVALGTTMAAQMATAQPLPMMQEQGAEAYKTGYSSSVQTTQHNEPVSISVSFGDIIVQSKGGQVDEAAIQKQIERAVRTALQQAQQRRHNRSYDDEDV